MSSEGDLPRDLADVAEPILSDFVPRLKSQADLAAFRLSEAQVQAFEDDGYVTGVDVLDGHGLELLLNDLERVIADDHPRRDLFYEFHSNESGDPDAVLLHALGHWRIEAGFHDLAFHPAITVPASQLLGDVAVRFWHDQLFCKPPRHGGNVAWHQDYSYWQRTEPLAHLTIHIALDDQTVDNGCLHYIPGSHKWADEVLPITSRHFTDMDSILTILTDEQVAAFKPEPMLLKAGQAAIHHGLTIHGSYGNTADVPRRAAVINVVADGVRSASDEALLDGVDVVPAGEPLAGKFFPIVLDPATLPTVSPQ